MAKDHPVAPLSIERTCWQRGYKRIAGIDEAGRGCLAGPVVAAAVLFTPGIRVGGVTDSKKLSHHKRNVLAGKIRASARSVGVGVCSPEEIDRLNILHAALEAMRRAVVDLEVAPDYLLVDGNRCFANSRWPYETVVGGDNRSFTIAAASIIAKTTRDAIMTELHQQYPHYGWDTNRGYPTRKHYEGLKARGATPYHRQSFRLA